MNLHVLRTIEARMKGVIGQQAIDPDDVYVFPETREGAGFHMRGVPFPIVIIFLDKDQGILDIQFMSPEIGLAMAPNDTVMAVETTPDYPKRHGLKKGGVWMELSTMSQQGLL